ncbi:hypothetical protein VD0002_g9455 [Verticillium dahliae]|uniref:Mitochondrial carrier protein n=1 Tax=Verticillium dahliae TaxID=27337 RepID=A0AA45AIW2_VERDA|nr:hypothetical protein BJF96_g8540 [Verticillium dahliae]PNH49200.1 hypothetical protein VD0003_g7934 [Verticillium dahliae]PNH58065.1 hypothetical protein VD0002_g9455 [Verticillium dahliae]
MKNGPADGSSPAQGPPYDPTTGFPSTGVLPVVPPDLLPDKNPRSNAATAASAAGVRALSAQAIAFYFRAPVKAFFRTRVDYLAWARSVHLDQIQQQLQRRDPASAAARSRFQNGLRHTWDWLRGTTPGVLTTAIRRHGWGVVPNQILPPLLANVTVGAVLYTSYLQILGQLHEQSARARRTVYPPPEPVHTFTAGLLAGALQSLVAAPLDAIQARYDHRDLMPPADGRAAAAPKSMWTFSAEKLREIGPGGIFAGYGLSLLKDGLGSAVFFSTFEYVKAQSYYRFVTWYYGDLNEDMANLLATRRPTRAGPRADDNDGITPLIIKPHYAIEPLFLLLAGVTASFAQQAVMHPLTHFQLEHWDHLEDIDQKTATMRADAAARGGAPARGSIFRIYYHAYQETWAQCEAAAAAQGRSVRSWLYRGFWWNTIRQVPSTSAGLIIFELVRRKYGLRSDEVRINKDGYDIQLN